MKDLEPFAQGAQGREDAPSLSPQLIAVMTQALFEFSRKPKDIQAIMRKHGIVIDNLDDKMQKFAFTLYTDIVEIAHQSAMLLENYQAEVDPEGHAAKPESERMCESMPSARRAPEASAPEGSIP
jgi:arginine/lysine/ornithine decarboxylase